MNGECCKIAKYGSDGENKRRTIGPDSVEPLGKLNTLALSPLRGEGEGGRK